MDSYDYLWLMAAGFFLLWTYELHRAGYWKKRYFGLRDAPLLREIARQLSEQDIVDRAAQKDRHP